MALNKKRGWRRVRVAMLVVWAIYCLSVIGANSSHWFGYQAELKTLRPGEEISFTGNDHRDDLLSYSADAIDNITTFAVLLFVVPAIGFAIHRGVRWVRRGFEEE